MFQYDTNTHNLFRRDLSGTEDFTGLYTVLVRKDIYGYRLTGQGQ